MKIYLHSENAERHPKYVVTIAPAGDVEFVSSEDCKPEWKNAKGDPLQIEVVFDRGVAEVNDSIGKYMVARGIAMKSRLLRRVQQLFDRSGRPIYEVFDQHGTPILLDARE